MLAATLLEENFNAGATGWTSSAGTWSTATTPGWVTAPTGLTSDLDRDSANFSAFSSAIVTPHQRVAGWIGVAFRVQDASTYYGFMWTGTTRQLQRVIEDSHTPLDTQAGPAFVANRWYHMGSRATGTQLTVYVTEASRCSARLTARSPVVAALCR